MESMFCTSLADLRQLVSIEVEDDRILNGHNFS